MYIFPELPAPALLVLQHQNSHGPLFVRAADWDKMGDEEDPLQGAGGEAPAAPVAAQIVVQHDGAPRVRIIVRINGSSLGSALRVRGNMTQKEFITAAADKLLDRKRASIEMSLFSFRNAASFAAFPGLHTNRSFRTRCF